MSLLRTDFCKKKKGTRVAGKKFLLRRGGRTPPSRHSMATMLYHYFKKIDGNVCMDWRLTSDLSTSLQTGDGKTKRVNAKAFEQFLNPDFQGVDAGTCQGAGQSLDESVCFAVNAGKETAGAARFAMLRGGSYRQPSVAAVFAVRM